MSGYERLRKASLRFLGSSLSVRLTMLLLASMAAVFALLGTLNIRLHRGHLEAATLQSAERVSDVIKRSTSHYMLRNDREGLYHIISTMADEPGMVRIRIFNQEGKISYSSDPHEVNTYVDKSAEACYGCHAQTQPLVHLDRPDRFRIYRDADRSRVLGIVNPIENSPSCSEAACHAHPAEQKILGVLDTNLSLAGADASLTEGSWQMVSHILFGALAVSMLSGLFVWRVLHHPLRQLKTGTEVLAGGRLGHQIQVTSGGELRDLGVSFNQMSRQLRSAYDEITEWNRTLEQRVEQKTRELKQVHEHMLQTEKMAATGKLSAIVAHEINNPLSGILTYAKLLRKRLDRGTWGEPNQEEIRNSLQLIESESKRCGDIVRNLLIFARAAPMNLEWANLNSVIADDLRLVEHQLQMTGTEVSQEVDGDLPEVRCDPAQLKQALLALFMNAIEAMPGGGQLRVACRRLEENKVEVAIEDNGIGIPQEHLPHVFEPFFSTKEGGRGTGLGLSVSHGIVERHGGHIEVRSEPVRGTRVVLTLPVHGADGADGQLDPAPSSAQKEG